MIDTQNQRVSVIIPCHNAENWIGVCLDSVISQTYKQIEIIFIDDGSTDRSLTIANERLCRSRIPYKIVRTHQAGPSRARNIGWRMATGEWVQFLDADDIIRSDKIQRQLAHAQRFQDEVAVIYSSWTRFADEISNPLEVNSQITSPHLTQLPIDLLQSENFVQLGSALVRRNWLERINGFDDNMWFVEDVNLLIRMAIAGGNFQSAPVDHPLLYYRQHADSLSSSKPVAFYRGCLINAQIVDESSELEQTPYQKSILIDAYSMIARNCLRADSATFEVALSALKRLTGKSKYIPSNPRHMAIASQILGYRAAEAFAYQYRKLRSLFRFITARRVMPG